MSPSLHQLVYASRTRIAGSPYIFDAEFGSILAVSRRNNVLAGITSALLFNAGGFAQVLEGPKDAIEATFDGIRQDARHADVSLLSLQPIARRSCSAAAIGFLGHSEEVALRLAQLGLPARLDPSRLDAARILSIVSDLTFDERTAIAA